MLYLISTLNSVHVVSLARSLIYYAIPRAVSYTRVTQNPLVNALLKESLIP